MAWEVYDVNGEALGKVTGVESEDEALEKAKKLGMPNAFRAEEREEMPTGPHGRMG